MEEKSIYDFIEDNLNINGKKGRSCKGKLLAYASFR